MNVLLGTPALIRSLKSVFSHIILKGSIRFCLKLGDTKSIKMKNLKKSIGCQVKMELTNVHF